MFVSNIVYFLVICKSERLRSKLKWLIIAE